MKAFTPKEMLLLNQQGGIPKALIDGWSAKNGENLIDVVNNKKSLMWVAELWAPVLLLIGAVDVGVMAVFSIYAPIHMLSTIIIAGICFPLAMFCLVLRHNAQIAVTEGCGKNYALLLVYFGTKAAKISHEQHVLINTASDLLTRQGLHLRTAESRSKANEQNFHDKNIADREREEFKQMFNTMAAFGLVDRKAGWDPFTSRSVA